MPDRCLWNKLYFLLITARQKHKYTHTFIYTTHTCWHSAEDSKFRPFSSNPSIICRWFLQRREEWMSNSQPEIVEKSRQIKPSQAYFSLTLLTRHQDDCEKMTTNLRTGLLCSHLSNTLPVLLSVTVKWGTRLRPQSFWVWYKGSHCNDRKKRLYTNNKLHWIRSTLLARGALKV